jgi:hypothetical protein
MATPTRKQAPCRILCLHGHGTSSEIFQFQLMHLTRVGGRCRFRLSQSCARPSRRRHPIALDRKCVCEGSVFQRYHMCLHDAACACEQCAQVDFAVTLSVASTYTCRVERLLIPSFRFHAPLCRLHMQTHAKNPSHVIRRQRRTRVGRGLLSSWCMSTGWRGVRPPPELNNSSLTRSASHLCSIHPHVTPKQAILTAVIANTKRIRPSVI